ncbi:hypothetical protein Tco_0679175 [Tanacetum coccineum]|uniref:Uncharacterized protein n=1 Tax=Tanacetum coccineum TaxID=301880 RepID=A0ABQ4XH97_9ASTR
MRQLLSSLPEYYYPFDLHLASCQAAADDSASLADFPRGDGVEGDVLWVDDAFVPELRIYLSQGSLTRKERKWNCLRGPYLSKPSGDRGGAPIKRMVGALLEKYGRDNGTCAGATERIADVAGAESEAEEVDSGLKRKRGTSDDGAVSQKLLNPPQTSPVTADDISRRGRETGPKAFEGMPVDQLMGEFDMVTAQQAALGWALLRSKLAEEKMALLVKAEQERADAAEYKASCHWAVKYLEGVRTIILAGWVWIFRKSGGAVGEAGGEVTQTQYRAEAVEELHEKKLLTVPAAQVPGYNQNAYEELVAAMEAMKLLELPHITQLERDQDYLIDVIMAGLTLARHATEGAEAQPDYFLKPDVAQLQVPIFASPRDILNHFALEKEIPLKESLEAHAIRLAKKKGVKGKEILCSLFSVCDAHSRLMYQYQFSVGDV